MMIVTVVRYIWKTKGLNVTMYVVQCRSSLNRILRANGYEYIEILIGVSPYTILESLWQAASS
jgi:hypothetical protein